MIRVKSNMKKVLTVTALFVAAVSLSIVCGCTQGTSVGTSQGSSSSTEVTGLQHHDGYELEQMTVVSRHNIRSPLSGAGSTAAKLTNRQWFNWTSQTGELSLKGGLSETSVGQYFRKYLEQENFIPENWVPSGNEVYVYANSMQRTIATANFFITGMIPVANVDVNHKYDIEKKDDVFTPIFTQMNDTIKQKIYAESDQQYGEGGLQSEVDRLSENYKLLEDTIDFKNSTYAQENNVDTITTGDSYITLENGKEPTMNGPLRTGNEIVDPIKMQYYEIEDDAQATFDKNLSYDQVKELSEIGDAYHAALFTGHTVATQTAHRMLVEINKDINDSTRKFTFLCGHDTTVIPTLYGLDCEKYELPNTISTMAPIGVKIVFGKYKNAAGEEFMNVNVVYETTDQLRHKAICNTDNPPMAYEISFKGMEKNSDGMYKLSDFQNRLNQSIADYDVK